ncbi:TonB-dependent receptor [Pseudomaricurvus alkylphenolicus]|uniref:TonB-dependent receptor n=1 Tax=Pseudomaricurvus alkylphenolicus TaxID=1306991 RepID=UPI00141E2359|nr:TonB-dependent receptor [Pseudomaricurvus alkylphenolicus]NIB39017.1 TonB-dependent receptor [Pseudomaricurvus alkylphenolicus]
MKKNLSSTLAMSVLASAISASVTAQSVDEGWAIEEIVVTAQKRAQNLQDVPIAVTALSADKLAKGAVVTLSDISQNVPGLTITDTQADDVRISVRGINSDDASFAAEQSIPVYLDGAYMGIGLPLIGDLEDIAQVEVLKGPQGTLFGRNALGGAVSVTTADVSDDFEGKVSARLGTYDLRKLNTTINLPLIDDTLAMRVNLGKLDRDGWAKNIVTGDRDGWEQDRWLARVKLKWTPTDDLEITWTSDKKKEDDHVGYNHLNELTDIFGNPGTAFPRTAFSPAAFDITGTKTASGSYNIAAAFGGAPGVSDEPHVNNRISRDIEGHAAKAVWDINDDLTLTSITSYRVLESYIEEDRDGTEYLLASVRSGIDSDEFSQEFRLNGTGENIDWFIGVSGFKQEVDGLSDSSFGSYILGSVLRERNENISEIESYGIFGDVIWSVTDKLSLTWGARYSYDEKVNKILTPAQDTLGPGINALFPHAGQLTDSQANLDPSLANLKEDWVNFSMRGAVSYQFSNEVMAYLNISQGYKSGGFNGYPLVDLGTGLSAPGQMEPFDEEIITAYELGVKSTLMDGRLRFNASYFYYDWEDLQVQTENNGVIRTDNAGKAVGQGIDLELAFHATENLALSASLGWLDTELKEGIPGNPDFVEGSERTYSPSFSGNVAADYFVAVSDLGEVYFHVDYSYNGEQLISPGLEMDSYGLVNARVGFTDPEGGLDISLWSRNLTDEEYLTSNKDFSTVGFTSLKRNEPRTYGVDVSYHF